MTKPNLDAPTKASVKLVAKLVAGAAGELQRRSNEFQAEIIAKRPLAQRVGMSLLDRWRGYIDLSERTALIDRALVEAVHKYDAERGASFVTFFFYVLLGELKRYRRLEPGFNDAPFFSDSEVEIGDLKANAPSPEEAAYHAQLRRRLRAALEVLPRRDREVVLAVYVGGEKVAPLARRLGFSRGYVSWVKRRGTQRMQKLLNAELHPQRRAA